MAPTGWRQALRQSSRNHPHARGPAKHRTNDILEAFRRSLESRTPRKIVAVNGKHDTRTVTGPSTRVSGYRKKQINRMDATIDGGRLRMGTWHSICVLSLPKRDGRTNQWVHSNHWSGIPCRASEGSSGGDGHKLSIKCQALRVLIIDEISMISAELFGNLDYVVTKAMRTHGTYKKRADGKKPLIRRGEHSDVRGLLAAAPSVRNVPLQQSFGCASGPCAKCFVHVLGHWPRIDSFFLAFVRSHEMPRPLVQSLFAAVPRWKSQQRHVQLLPWTTDANSC